MSTKCIVLLSGGLDSATVAAIARRDGFEITALSFIYGQRHAIELDHARDVASFIGVSHHHVIEINPGIFRSALMADSTNPVPRNRDMDGAEIIPDTYVPARNILFLSYALALAESSGIRDIFIGANAVDYSGYPDCRPEFFRAFTLMANAGTRAGVSGEGFAIHTPIISMTKGEIIRLGFSLGVDY